MGFTATWENTLKEKIQINSTGDDDNTNTAWEKLETS